MTARAACPDPLIPDLYRRHLSRARARLAEFTGGVQEVSSHAAYVHAADGRRFLDCGGYGVFLVGHTHPAVVGAVVAQARTHPMSTRLLLEPTAALAAAALAAVTPDGLDRVHFVNSGAEATEAAVKLARLHGKRRLLSAQGGFHGKTTGALSLTAKELYQEPFRPLLPDVTHVPYGDVSALADSVGADTCLFLEPVQGEGGVIVPPDGYLTEARRLCRERGAMLVLDEIQTGLGRLGTWWGADPEGISPDILLVGKGLSGGVVPVAAMVATDAAYEPFSRDPFLHTSTFAASPIAMAAARAAVETIRAEDMVARAASLGRTLLDGLTRIAADRCPGLVVQVRGAGLLIGVELRDAHTAGAFVMELHDRGVLVNHSLNAHTVIRLTPPAVLTRSDVDWLFTAFDAAATTLEGTL